MSKIKPVTKELAMVFWQRLMYQHHELTELILWHVPNLMGENQEQRDKEMMEGVGQGLTAIGQQLILLAEEKS